MTTPGAGAPPPAPSSHGLVNAPAPPPTAFHATSNVDLTPHISASLHRDSARTNFSSCSHGHDRRPSHHTSFGHRVAPVVGVRGRGGPLMFPYPAPRLLLGFPLSDLVRANLPQGLFGFCFFLFFFSVVRSAPGAGGDGRDGCLGGCAGQCHDLFRFVFRRLPHRAVAGRAVFVTLPRGRSDVDDSGDACSLRALHGSPRELPSESLSARDIVHLRAAGWAWKDYLRCGLWVVFFFGSLEPGPLCRQAPRHLRPVPHSGRSHCRWIDDARLTKEKDTQRPKHTEWYGTPHGSRVS